MNRCRRYHPVYMTHAQLWECLVILETRKDEGSYFGNEKQFRKRLGECINALDDALMRCPNDMEKPKR